MHITYFIFVLIICIYTHSKFFRRLNDEHKANARERDSFDVFELTRS